MLTLRSPDNRLRLDFALLAGGRVAASGAPALRVTLGGCTLLGWSRLPLPSPTSWRCATVARPRQRSATLSCAITLAAPARRAPRWRLTLRCANGGIAFRLASRGGRPDAVADAPRCGLPRASQALVADPATGSFALHKLAGGRLAIAGAVQQSRGISLASLPLTLIYPHGKCAALLRVAIGAAPWWLLLAGDRPCDLPSGVAIAALLGHEIESHSQHQNLSVERCSPFSSPCGSRGRSPSLTDPIPPTPDLSVARCALRVERCPSLQSSVSSFTSRHNCFLPFTRSPDWPPASFAPAVWRRPITDGVTAAHRLALHLIMGTQPPADGAGEPAAARVAWDETLWLRGEMGEYVLLARRQGACWWVGAITARPRVLTLRLGFLEPGASYRAQAWCDGGAAALPPLLTASDKPVLPIAAAGGFLLRLEPESGPC